MDPQTQLDLSKLNDADKKELNQILANEAQKSNIQQSKSSTRKPKQTVDNSLERQSLLGRQELC